MEIFPDYQTLLTTAYGIAGAVGIAAYLPQAWALWRDNSGSKNMSLLMWGVWGVQTIVYVLYAIFVVQKPAFVAVMFGTLAVTHLCLWLLVYNRYFRKLPHNRRASDPKLPAVEMGERY
jgi:hypothetical protein